MVSSSDLALMGAALAGAAAGCLLALLPGLHVYSFAALALLLIPLQSDALAMAFMGALVGWATVNTLPMVFLRTADDAQAMAVLPATRYMLQGRGAEAALLTGAGSLCAMLALVILAPALDEIVRPLRAVLQPHLGWMLLAIMVFLLLGEWPRHNDLAGTPMGRLRSAWAYLGAGLLTFFLSGLLGLALFYRNPMPLDAAFQGLMPAFTGLFAVPALLQLMLSKGRAPAQSSAEISALQPNLLLRGAATGVAGGLFATLLPVVTGGIGGLLAGHATAQRDERAFMISLGASKGAGRGAAPRPSTRNLLTTRSSTSNRSHVARRMQPGLPATINSSNSTKVVFADPNSAATGDRRVVCTTLLRRPATEITHRPGRLVPGQAGTVAAPRPPLPR